MGIKKLKQLTFLNADQLVAEVERGSIERTLLLQWK